MKLTKEKACLRLKNHEALFLQLLYAFVDVLFIALFSTVNKRQTFGNSVLENRMLKWATSSVLVLYYRFVKAQNTF